MMRGMLMSMAAAVAVLGGCSAASKPGTLAPIASPTATVDRVELVDASEQAGRYLIYVTLTNPNEVPLPMTDATYTLTVAGQTAEGYSGDVAPNATLPASSSIQVRLPAVVAGAPGAGREGAYEVDGRFRVFPPGEVKKIAYEMGWPLPRVGFESSGPVTANLGGGEAEAEIEAPVEIEGDTTTPTAPRREEQAAPADQSQPTTPGVDID